MRPKKEEKGGKELNPRAEAKVQLDTSQINAAVDDRSDPAGTTRPIPTSAAAPNCDDSVGMDPTTIHRTSSRHHRRKNWAISDIRVRLALWTQLRTLVFLGQLFPVVTYA